MPATLIGIHKWDVAHSKQLKDLLGASFEAALQVRSSDAALLRGAAAEAAVYGEGSASYWAKYFIGTDGAGRSADGKTKVPIERDKTGIPVPLGGSSVETLAGALAFYGMSEGTGGPSASLWRATYEGFGNIAKQQYPKRVASFPKYDKAFNSTFLQLLAQEAAAPDVATSKADLPKFAEGEISTADQVAKRDWTINFETGKATFTPQALETLQQLFVTLQQSQGLAAEFDGHTDNVGNADANLGLSLRRANAMKDWMQAKAPALFPENRITTKGYGDEKPVASNATAEGRAANRRVTVILGTK
jgi:outer membrane protein OmpA-like peptidoglycan-associated protein